MHNRAKIKKENSEVRWFLVGGNYVSLEWVATFAKIFSYLYICFYYFLSASIQQFDLFKRSIALPNDSLMYKLFISFFNTYTN